MNHFRNVSLPFVLALLIAVVVASSLHYGFAAGPELPASINDTTWPDVSQLTDAYKQDATATLTPTITIVLVPSMDASVMLPPAEALANLLEQETGFATSIYIAGCYGAVLDALATHQADLSFLPASGYVYAHDSFGAEVKLVMERFGATSFRGQFMVHKDSGITDLAGLAGLNFAYTGPGSLSGHLYPFLHISNTVNVSPSIFFGQELFAGSHSGVVRAVYHGDHDGTPVHGGVAFDDARDAVIGDLPDVFTQVQVIDYTGFIPNDTVVTRPGMDALVSQQVISGLLNVSETPEGQASLQQLFGAEGLQPTVDSAYDIVREFVAHYGFDPESCSQMATLPANVGGTLVVTGTVTTTVQVPASAITETLELSYAPVTAVSEKPHNLVDTGYAYSLNAVRSGTGQVVTRLQTPYTITITYQDDQITSIFEPGLGLYYWNGAQWIIEPSTHVDPDQNMIYATPDHFSNWAVFGDANHPLYLPMIQN